MGMDQDTGLAEVLAANEHFYDVFRSGDLAAMERLWSAREDCSVCHPEWPAITSRKDVMASFHRIMVLSEPPAVFPRDPVVVRQGRTAIVFCTEQVEDQEMTASNVFVEEEGVWRLTCHHARPLPPAGSECDDDDEN